MERPIQSVVDVFGSDDWYINEWKIQFLLSERHLYEIRKIASTVNWYEDQIVAATCTSRLAICFESIYKYHKTFGTLPIIGDRLFDEDSGMKVHDRSIDGASMTITFVLGN
ncbi:hypothetical protein [Spirosoma rhododendri]|uniref:Uncharacterized protein n=1 Tax=Spirosoma rhododendri TaxID=2728024 RepID=A0A7L5DJ73_9BACT|nr:hypothetical protein [Spirosoma rhododendri]QJD78436.1 hypothetical protein HH216_08370 [Spirosoma rhododendri]